MAKSERPVTGGAFKLGLIVPLMVTALAVSGWNGCQDRRIADELRRDSVEVDAVIVDYQVRAKHTAAVGDTVKVAFTTLDGRQVETRVVVGTNREPPSPTRVRYLRTDPSVARLATDPAPRAGALPFYLILFAVLGVIGAAVFWFFREMDRQLGLR